MSLNAEQLGRIRVAAENTFPFVTRCGVKVLELARGYCKMLMPFEPNINHVGMMYAGALYTIAELPGGVIYLTSFDTSKYYPIVKDMQIRFRRPAMGDVTVSVRVSEEEIAKYKQAKEYRAKYRKLLSEVKKQIKFLRSTLRGKQSV